MAFLLVPIQNAIDFPAKRVDRSECAKLFSATATLLSVFGCFFCFGLFFFGRSYFISFWLLLFSYFSLWMLPFRISYGSFDSHECTKLMISLLILRLKLYAIVQARLSFLFVCNRINRSHAVCNNWTLRKLNKSFVYFCCCQFCCRLSIAGCDYCSASNRLLSFQFSTQ